MKRRMTQVIIALSLIAALVMSLAVEYHHHDADGSMCLGFTCHADCHGHDTDKPCDEDGCGMHLDCFCCDGHHHHVAVPTPDSYALITFSVSVPEITEEFVKGCGSIFCERRVPRPLIESRALRAPPVDNYA
ncbi:MAG: hypothetical protein K2M00_03090 [Muribaculaceae bacterium]|nr:hypothetical protein [Muribaculaceae bacterium]